MTSDSAPWYFGAGLLLTAIAVLGSRVARWPMSLAMLYLLIGVGLGLSGALDLNLPADVRWLEIASEIAVILSLFSAGLRLRLSRRPRRWVPPVLLATVGMVATIGLVAAGAVWLLDLSWPLALVLGAILAPTDPVLAADVQVANARDRDRLRATLTGEAGLNDGMAFPFLLLGLALLAAQASNGSDSSGASVDLWHWLGVDVVWRIGAGAAVGALLGWSVTAGVLRQRRTHRHAVGFDEFLALGLIAVTYGAALLIHAYGFIAVFAAGLAMRVLERHESQDEPEAHNAAMAALPEAEIASSARHAPAFLAEAVLRFNSQIDRIAELTLVIAVGVLLVAHPPTWATVGLALFLIGVARPLAVAPLCAMTGYMTGSQVRLTAWFGIRGIGSIYYLMVALAHGAVAEDQVGTLVSATLAAIALSTLMHGTSATPLMRMYRRKAGSGAAKGGGE